MNQEVAMKIKVTFKDVLEAQVGTPKTPIQIFVKKILDWLKSKSVS